MADDESALSLARDETDPGALIRSASLDVLLAKHFREPT